ncbi:MAG: 30S ribosomal protein S1 [Spirochaetota bacterium]|nr:MAG: 30S ribosomal protein S1 [Spirochaetota bacterium]
MKKEDVLSNQENKEDTGLKGDDLPNEMFKEEFIKDLSTFVEGQIVEGTVVAVTQDSVFIDIGYKSEGEVSKNEFKQTPTCGEITRVMIIRRENKEGKPVLSKQKADEIVKWDSIQEAYREGLPIEGKITEAIKGGFTVDIEGLKGFLPASQLSMKKGASTEDYLGKMLLFKIDRLNGKSNIILSHKKYLKELKEKKMEEFFKSKYEGDLVEGIIKDIMSYGVFVDLGGIDGFLHNNDLSWAKLTDPKKYVKRGEKINCKILTMDAENRKVALGLKQMIPDPWLSFKKRYKKGEKYRGTVTNLTNFGAFIELEEGIEGLLHVSDLSWTKRIKHPNEILKVGDIVEIMILDYDAGKKTVSLGLKQVLPNPWDFVDVHYPVGSRIKTKATKVTKFGVFLELEEGIVGLLHTNDLSWTKTVKDPSMKFKKGDSVEVEVLSIDKENKKIQLGLKQLKKNPWDDLKARHPKGSVITGNVTNITDFGIFVKVDEEIEGLIHLSQISNERIEDPCSLYKVGDEVKAIILEIDEEKKKVTLSIKEYLNHLEEKEITKYLEDTNTASVALGDLIDLSGIGT